MESDQERRQYIRIPKEYRVEIQKLSYPLHSEDKIQVSSADISLGGVRVSCSQRFDPGQKIQIRVYIAGLNKYHPGYFKVFENDVGQYIQAVAEVSWVQEKVPLQMYDLGCKFLDVYEDDWQALRGLLAKMS